MYDFDFSSFSFLFCFCSSNCMAVYTFLFLSHTHTPWVGRGDTYYTCIYYTGPLVTTMVSWRRIDDCAHSYHEYTLTIFLVITMMACYLEENCMFEQTFCRTQTAAFRG